MNIKSRYGPHSMLQGSLIINRNAPFCVLDCNGEMENILGYRPDEVVGRSIKFLYGPSTDTKEIHAAIKGSSMGQQGEIKALLYGRTGVSLNVMVRCHQDEQDCIQLTIANNDKEDPMIDKNRNVQTHRTTPKPFTRQVFDRVCIAQHVQSFAHTKKFRCFQPQTSIQYHPFCDDFGPMNLACVVRFIGLLDQELAADPASKIVYCVDMGRRALTNAAFLLGAYGLLKLNQSADQVEDRFSWLDGSMVEPFRDATFTEPDFGLTLRDCWRGLERGMHAGWLLLPPAGASSQQWGRIDTGAYAHFDEPLNGDLHTVVPDKLVAFRGPRDLGPAAYCDDGGHREFSPAFYGPVLRELGVTEVVRLNEAEYGAEAFASCGLAHHDLPFDDCSAPPDDVVRAFMDIVDRAEGAVAVHCRAGLGRTGTLIAVYMMRRHGFTAREAMGWLRVMRPGSVIGEQQHYLCAMEGGDGAGLSSGDASEGKGRREAQAEQVAAAARAKCRLT